MNYNLKYIPIVNAAAGVLSSRFVNRSRILAVDHLTITKVDPNDWDLVFVLCAETTFKIRPELDRLGDKVVLIHTSDEKGLEKYKSFFFPHWLFCVAAVNNLMYTIDEHAFLNKTQAKYSYNALVGRAKDPRTQLLTELDNKGLIDKGIISYHPGGHYGPNLKLDPSPYYSNVWEWEDHSIKNMYSTDINYAVKLDSTTRLLDGHFSSCLIPWKIINGSLVTVVSETDNYGSHSFLTEKTWKPFLSKHPAIFYATKNHEDFLESLGFEMYVKTNGDPAKVASIISDIERGGYKDYTLTDWRGIIIHNQSVANPMHWIYKLHSWLEENFIS